jgi:hypothetical protein
MGRMRAQRTSYRIDKSRPYRSGSVHSAAGRWTRQHHDDAEVRPSDAAYDEGRVPEKGPIMSDETGAPLANGRPGLRGILQSASLKRRVRFSDIKDFGTPRQKLRGFLGTQG